MRRSLNLERRIHQSDFTRLRHCLSDQQYLTVTTSVSDINSVSVSSSFSVSVFDKYPPFFVFAVSPSLFQSPSRAPIPPPSTSLSLSPPWSLPPPLPLSTSPSWSPPWSPPLSPPLSPTLSLLWSPPPISPPSPPLNLPPSLSQSLSPSSSLSLPPFTPLSPSPSLSPSLASPPPQSSPSSPSLSLSLPQHFSLTKLRRFFIFVKLPSLLLRCQVFVSFSVFDNLTSLHFFLQLDNLTTSQLDKSAFLSPTFPVFIKCQYFKFFKLGLC